MPSFENVVAIVAAQVALSATCSSAADERLWLPQHSEDIPTSDEDLLPDVQLHRYVLMHGMSFILTAAVTDPAVLLLETFTHTLTSLPAGHRYKLGWLGAPARRNADCSGPCYHLILCEELPQAAITLHAFDVLLTPKAIHVDCDVRALALRAQMHAKWHSDCQCCEKCGARVSHRGLAAVCECSHTRFPPYYPCVIVLLIDAETHSCALLAERPATSRRPAVLTHVAGFIDAGEHPEAAVRREVLEEVGVDLAGCRIAPVGCQPWPSSASLMLGYVAEAPRAALDAAAPDTAEVPSVRVTSAREVAAALRGGCELPCPLPGPETLATQMLAGFARA